MAGDLCRRCKELDLATIFDTERRVPDTQSLEDQLLSSFRLENLRENANCPFCQLLIRAIQQHEPTLRSVNDNLEVVSFDIIWEIVYLIDRDDHCGPALLSWLKIRPIHSVEPFKTHELKTPVHEFIIQRLAAKAGPFGNESCFGWGRRIGQKADIALLKGWVDLCCSEHSGCTPVTPSTGIPDLIIDVKRRCVIQVSEKFCYAALSYVWGGASKQLKLTNSTKQRLMSPGGLGDTYADVPKVISHDIQLCHGLEVPFLWVDALCINQESIRSSNHLSRNMHQIYGGALFTIVGVAGMDCWAGLPAFVGERNSEQCRIDIGGLILAASTCDYPHLALASKWNTRAWTLQERVISKCLMLFTENQVLWECDTYFQEDVSRRTPSSGSSNGTGHQSLRCS